MVQSNLKSLLFSFCLLLASTFWTGRTKESSKTATIPALAATTSVHDITENSAISVGNVTSDGGADVTERGSILRIALYQTTTAYGLTTMSGLSGCISIVFHFILTYFSISS